MALGPEMAPRMMGGVDDADEDRWRREWSRGEGEKKSPRAPGIVTNGVEEEEKAREPEMAPRMMGGVDDADEEGWRREKRHEKAGNCHQWRRRTSPVTPRR